MTLSQLFLIAIFLSAFPSFHSKMEVFALREMKQLDYWLHPRLLILFFKSFLLKPGLSPCWSFKFVQTATVKLHMFVWGSWTIQVEENFD